MECTIKGDHNSTNLVKREGFTTNKNYLGHNPEGVPYYYDPHLKEGEIKYIMTKEFTKLPDGKYEAKVEQVIRKHGKTNDVEDPNKEIISLELNVKGHTDKFYYINFCVKGYGADQIKYAQEDLDKLMQEFGVTIIEELAGKEGIVTAKTKPDGNSAMYFNAPKVFFNWGEVLTVPCEARFPCIVNKFYKKDTKYIFIVKVNVNSKTVEEFVVYDTANEMKAQSLKWLCDKLSLDLATDASKDLTDKNAFLVVKRVDADNGVTYYNKRIGFEKKAKRKPKAW